MLEHYLAIHPKAAKQFCDDDINATEATEQTEASIEANSFNGVQQAGGVIAVLSMMGGIRHRSSYGTSVQGFREKFREALANPNVKAIVFNVDSPGGTVSGVPELAEEIFQARAIKPIIAVADVFAASAAYWLAAAATKLLVTPSGSVGSIGVFAMHVDQSKLLQDVGFKVTLISAGRYKVEGNSFQPLSEEAHAQIQKDVDSVYEDFITAVAKFRGTDVERVLNDFGQGRMVMAKDAVAVNMADGIDTLDNVINNLVTVQQSRRRASARLQLASI